MRHILSALLACWLALVAEKPALAAVSFGGCEASAFSLPNGMTTATDSGFTVGAGANQLLVLLVAQGNSAGTTTATWNGTSLSAVTGASNTNSPVRTEILVLVAPTQGNQSLVINSTLGWQFSNSMLCYFNGVNQSTPTQNGASANALSENITSAVGDMVIATMAASGTISATNNNTIWTNGGNGTGGNYASGASSVTMSATGSGTSSISGADMQAASAASVVCQRALLGVGC